MRKLILPLVLCGLIGCASAPLTNQIEGSSRAIQDLAAQVDRLQDAGTITKEQEDRFLDRLAQANQTLRNVNILASTCSPDCSDAQNQLLALNQLLIQLQSEVKP